jgi:acetyltransferase
MTFSLTPFFFAVATGWQGALSGSDAVFSAALQRAGILRVDHIDDLFTAVETLACCDVTNTKGKLTILTNGFVSAVCYCC